MSSGDQEKGGRIGTATQGTTRRRALTLAGTSLFTTASLAGYTRQGNKVELLFWHTEPEQTRREKINEISQTFVDQYDGPISVTAKPVDETQINQEVLAGAAAGTLPNLILPNVQMIQQLGAKGLLAKQAVGEAIDRIGRDRFLNGPLSMLKAGESGHYGIPHSAFINTFWYRKSVWEEQGLPKPNTWEGLRKSAKALHKPDNNQFGIGTANKKDVYMRQCFIPFAFSNGGRALNEKGDVVFDSPEIVEALRAYADIAQYNPPGKHGYETTLQTYLDETIYNTMWSTYILDDILKTGGQEMVDDTQIVPAIKHSQEGVIGLTQGLTILNAENRGISKQKVQASIDFAEYLYTDEAYIPFLHLAPGGFRPVLDDITQKEAYQDNKVLNAWGDTLDQINKAINSEGFGQFGIVNGKVFPSFGNATGQLLIAEAPARVIDGDDPETVAKEQAEKIRKAMESA